MVLVNSKQKQGIGARLKFERERLGYSEQQIAQLLGVPLETYRLYESGEADPGLFSTPRLADIGFDLFFIIKEIRYVPGIEEVALIKRFRHLSLRGKNTVFRTLDALERLAPNLKNKIKNPSPMANEELP